MSGTQAPLAGDLCVEEVPLPAIGPGTRVVIEGPAARTAAGASGG
jgi:hypothetical protein